MLFVRSGFVHNYSTHLFWQIATIKIVLDITMKTLLSVKIKGETYGLQQM